MIPTHVLPLMKTLSKTWEGNGRTPVGFEGPLRKGPRNSAHHSGSSARVQLHFNRSDMVSHCWEKHLAANATKIYQGQQSLWLVWLHTSRTDKDAQCWEVHLTQRVTTQRIFSRLCVNEQDSRSVQPRHWHRTLHGRREK